MKGKYLFLLFAFALFLAASCGGGKTAKLNNSLDSVSYAIGVSQGTGLKMGMKRSSIELNEDLLLAGIRHALSNDSLAVMIKPDDAVPIIQAYLEKRETEKKLENLENGRKFLAENANKAGIQVTSSGLQYRIEREGTGSQPRAFDTVEVNYRGMLIDGKEFESSYANNKPIKFYLSGVIKGWTEGIQLMKEGGKYTFYIPTELAYGEYIYPNSPFEANVPLVFDVELIKVIPGKEPAK